MPSVLVPIYDGSISKALVSSHALQPLVEAGYSVVLVVEERKVDYYRTRFGSLGYKIIPHPVMPRSALRVRFQNIGVGSIPTKMMFQRHVRRMVERKKYGLGVLRLGVWFLGLLPPIRWVLQHLVVLHPIPSTLAAMVDTEKPDLIFCPTMLSLEEIDLLRYAKKRKIPVIGMVKTWDNVTTKLTLPVAPDYLIVHTPRVRDEAIKYYHYPASKISVVGLPQFDCYADQKFQESREDFCARVGLDPKIPYFLYCAAGLWMSPDEPEILTRLNADIEKGVFGPLQVLVRMHPKYDCGAEHLKDQKHLYFDRPGTYVSTDLTTWEYEDSDVKHLLSSLRHAAVTSNTASTMSIEAAYMDRPIVAIAFDPHPVSWSMSNKRYYEREYYLPIVQSGGARVAYSYDEFAQAIKDYLQDATKDHEGRERIVREQCISREPIAARTIGNVLLGYLKGETSLPTRL